MSFQRQIDTFFAFVADGNANQAQKQLAKYVNALPDHKLHSFAGYVAKNCHITIEHTDPDTILHCMESLITRSLSSQTNNYIIVSACEYIHKNFASCNISLETTADALSITYAHLSRLFKKHMKQNFSEYLLKIRMEHARTLLETTSLPTAEIAVAAGYENTAYFRTSFKAYFHMTPRQYRQITCEKEKRK